ncbi:MAG: tRNA uridine-5-carboxymethylaminomethyl(34) synthesis GTPase MnmE [Sphingomonadaceae bacterium]|uniref:tRNA uridine-5-carboxymethylaminomethyl(34) synthesis GTPase MnmE n=1 Tax=Thermaurantiacus sp. TaxID=2820283 RepID=UPI00298ED7D1|nr:tRNA uridine-5-carboxymethylaminomethyl(34) synthesis GTPase MnmE [Thermaurantiacus sp.]MCS6987681.1 tRNA uridine-5-carboxymethylaminomethyl(34) synthesis GTPase MnmE [Sphingomonadaceae bacterium]MDW8415282.1 tRNA uridine-5-carboxymethylaminomethyl(34) synthesis GTPase MnmE [Thermaurantiacus sp.]
MGPGIFALSSGPPPCGVAVLRLSGQGVLRAVGRLLRARRLPAPRRASVRTLVDPASRQPLDRALVLVFPAPASFTGEDMAELHLHGGPAVVAAVQQALQALGLRPAEAGEFTRRAFEGGRIDLTQAEALADLIAAETEAQRAQALAGAGGRLRALAEGWRARLVELRALAEAELDFADEPDVGSTDLGPALATLAAEVEQALASAPVAERVRQGLVIAVTGPPNAGKSTLVNALAAREVAIVSPHPGTTRDVIEVRLDLGGVPATLLDTAGLRDSSDPVEAEGIRRARARAAEADLVLALGDGPGLRVVNRIDLTGEAPGIRDGVAYVSALTGAGLDELRAWLVAWARRQVPRGEPPVVTTARQAQLLGETQACLREALVERDPVLRAEALRLAADALGRLTGAIGPEEVLGAIFGRFCIGK